MLRMGLAGGRIAATLCLALASILAAQPALACSICRCGDPTFNALGADIYASGRFIAALDWERLDKKQGVLEREGEPAARARRAFGGRAPQAQERETIVENRVTAALSYSFAERFNLVARVPYGTRALTEGGKSTRGKGLSDPEFYGLVRLWSSSFAPGLGRRSWLSAVAGVKTP